MKSSTKIGFFYQFRKKTVVFGKYYDEALRLQREVEELLIKFNSTLTD